jgi:hypothetical protein
MTIRWILREVMVVVLVARRFESGGVTLDTGYTLAGRS